MDDCVREAHGLFLIQNQNQVNQRCRRNVDVMFGIWRSKSKMQDLLQEFEKIIVTFETKIEPAFDDLKCRDVMVNPWTIPEIQCILAELKLKMLEFDRICYTNNILVLKIFVFSYGLYRRALCLRKELNSYYNTPVASWNKIMDPELSQYTVLHWCTNLTQIARAELQTKTRTMQLLSAFSRFQSNASEAIKGWELKLVSLLTVPMEIAVCSEESNNVNSKKSDSSQTQSSADRKRNHSQDALNAFQLHYSEFYTNRFEFHLEIKTYSNINVLSVCT